MARFKSLEKTNETELKKKQTTTNSRIKRRIIEINEIKFKLHVNKQTNKIKKEKQPQSSSSSS